MNAQSKGRRLGIFAAAAPDAVERPRRVRAAADNVVELTGRSIPVRRVAGGVRAVLGGQTVAAGVTGYLERSFGEALPRVEAEMRSLAAAYAPNALAAAAWSLYERLRPEIPPGQRGWGARGELDLHVIRALRPARARHDASRARDARAWNRTKETPTMGQAANSNRQAKLDQKKTRAAGRQANAVRSQSRDRSEEQGARGRTAGAFGKAGTANRPTGGYTQGAGGGGGAGSRPRAAAVAGKDKVGRSSRPARKRGA